MSDIDPLSDKARERLAAIEAKEARGEKVLWSDMIGICEPNPNLPDCQSWEGRDGPKCQLSNHHEGAHRAEVTW